MKNIFSYDSKLVTSLSFIADLFILNLLYLVCCLPLFTIGAAQAGLHNAVRILQDPLDGRSTVKAFFRGFKEGFGRITLAWLLFYVIEGILYYTLYITLTYENRPLCPLGIPSGRLVRGSGLSECDRHVPLPVQLHLLAAAAQQRYDDGVAPAGKYSDRRDDVRACSTVPVGCPVLYPDHTAVFDGVLQRGMSVVLSAVSKGV